MILGFSTQINNTPTFFVEKIWEAILQKGIEIGVNDFIEYGRKCLPKHYKVGTHTPKLHTIRVDKTNRWKKGNDIHFSINVRRKNQLQFAPVIKVVSVQKIEISHPTENLNDTVVKVDGKLLNENEVQQLAWNDGFDNLLGFWWYFKEDFKGNLIHWTNLTY